MVLSLTGQRCRADIFLSVMVFFEFYLIIMDMVPGHHITVFSNVYISKIESGMALSSGHVP